MITREIRAGNGTHTGRMLGYCPDCGLYHEGQKAAATCGALQMAASPSEEAIAWGAHKTALARLVSPPTARVGRAVR